MAAARLDETARGVFAIAVTPFTEDGVLDMPSTDRMVEFYLECGVSGLAILSAMGEASKLSHQEAAAFCRQVVARTAGRVPVVVGVSAPGLNAVHSITHSAMGMGAAGVMLAPMSGLRTDEQIEAYIHAACGLLWDVPVVLQDCPPSSGVHMSASLLNRLFAEVPNLVVLKHEDWPGLRKLTRFRTAEAAGQRRRASVLVGNGGLFLPLELQRGADGAMTGFAFPELLVEVCRRHAAGDVDGAENLFDAYLPLVRYEQQVGIGLAIRKETLRRRGVLASAATRLPGPAMDADDHAELDRLLDRLEWRIGAPVLPVGR